MSAQGPEETKPPRRKKSGGKGKRKRKAGPGGAAAAENTPQGGLPVLPLVLAGVALLGLTVWAWPPRPAPESHVKTGNVHYAHGEYPAALGDYENAPGAGSRYAGVQLDRGLARYRVAVPPPDGGGFGMLPADASAPEGLTSAQDELRTAARGGTTNATDDVEPALRASAAYDLANTMFSQHDWDHAIDTYKEALRLRPGWTDAAWNLELARRLREAERNPPDAGQDSGAPDASEDSGPPDAGPDSGSPDGSNQGDSGGTPDGGNNGGDSGAPQDSGNSRQDSGSGQDSSTPQGNDGGGNEPDASAPPRDAEAPRSMAPLDDLDRSSRSLQMEMLRRRGGAPRGPDDDR